MAKAVSVGMEPADLKRHLAMAKGDPVNCALGLSGDSAIGLIMMHKNKNPKAVEKELSGQFGDAKWTRWGTVSVDDEGLAKFTVNKATSGLARKLTKSLKGTGVRKVQIVLEDGTVVEGAAGDDEGDAEAPVEGEPAPGPTAAPQDVGALDKELRELITQIGPAAGGDPARMQELKAAAVAAAGAVKAQDAVKAAEAVEALKALLTPAGTNGGATNGAEKPVSFVAMQKSRLLWDSARKRVASEIAQLKKESLDLFEGDPEEAQVRDALDQLDDITGQLDERLMDALDDLLNEQDPAKHAELLKDAKDVLSDYASFVSSNELVQKLSGDTPFGMKLTIGPTYTSVIKALQAQLR